jgi:glycosyltransferase involved in cell wall biosynthesis
LLREADSLAAKGHDVRVVTPSFMPDLAARDERQSQPRNWRHQKIDYLPTGFRGKARSVLIRSRRRGAAELYKAFGGRRLGEYSYTTALPEQRRQTLLESADWFIAHAHAALPVAAAAARKWNSRLGFDCEDLLSERQTDPREIVKAIEQNYLSNCDYISVPSKAIGDYLQQQYGIEPPVVLYNVFPLELARDMTPPASRAKTRTVKCHWFSQTIGPGRGIEEAIEACGIVGANVELHLRGNPSPGYDRVLRSLAARHVVKLELHPQVDHDDLIESMGQFDVGLAIERIENVGAAFTVSNKVGSYLMAGLAIAATDTRGQREVLEQIPSTGFLYPSGKPELLANGLRKWVEDPHALRNAQQASWDSARRRFCWDIQQEKFFNALEVRQVSSQGASSTDGAHNFVHTGEGH